MLTKPAHIPPSAGGGAGWQAPQVSSVQTSFVPVVESEPPLASKGGCASMVVLPSSRGPASDVGVASMLVLPSSMEPASMVPPESPPVVASAPFSPLPASPSVVPPPPLDDHGPQVGTRHVFVGHSLDATTDAILPV